MTLVGRLTRDPEARGGGAVTAFRLALTSREKQGDEWGDKSNFFDVVCFGRTAEMVAAHCVKGRRVGVDGRLAWREWEAKDGGKRQAVEVVANDVFFLDAKPEGAAAAKPADVDDLPF